MNYDSVRVITLSKLIQVKFFSLSVFIFNDKIFFDNYGFLN